MSRFSEGLGQRDGEKSELKRIGERELHVPHGPYLPPNQTRMRSLLSIQVNCFPSLVFSWRRNLRQESLRTRTKDDKFAVDASLHPNGEKQYFCVRRLEARRKGIEILLFPRVLLSFPSKKIANYKTKSNSLKVLPGNNMLLF